jgi:hypothetical protein
MPGVIAAIAIKTGACAKTGSAVAVLATAVRLVRSGGRIRKMNLQRPLFYSGFGGSFFLYGDRYENRLLGYSLYSL